MPNPLFLAGINLRKLISVLINLVFLLFYIYNYIVWSATDLYNRNMENLPPVDPNCLVLPAKRKRQMIEKNIETRIRTLFVSKGYRKFPKKEYIRCKLIRGHKRVLRAIQEKENNLGAFLQEDMYSDGKKYYWLLIAESFVVNREAFTKLIPVDAGPVNVMMKKRNVCTENLKKSFNKEFCREYLEDEETRKSYSYYINYLFCDLDCERLKKIFGFRCCTAAKHKYYCQVKWIWLKIFCEQIVLEDIGVQPYSLPPKYSPVPSIFISDSQEYSL